MVSSIWAHTDSDLVALGYLTLRCILGNVEIEVLTTVLIFFTNSIDYIYYRDKDYKRTAEYN